MLVLEHGRAGATYHIGGGNQTVNIELLRLLLKILDRPETLLTHVTDRLGHDRRYAVDCSLIREELGWKPADLSGGRAAGYRPVVRIESGLDRPRHQR